MPSYTIILAVEVHAETDDPRALADAVEEAARAGGFTKRMRNAIGPAGVSCRVYVDDIRESGVGTRRLSPPHQAAAAAALVDYAAELEERAEDNGYDAASAEGKELRADLLGRARLIRNAAVFVDRLGDGVVDRYPPPPHLAAA